MKRKIFQVYCATNRISGKSYIGITSYTVPFRWRKHCARASKGQPKNGNCPALHAAIRKYGADSFDVIAIFSAFSWEDLCAAEIALIKDRGTFAPGGYNLTEGGEGVLGYKPSEEVRAASSARSKGHRASPETRAKMSVALRGLKRSAETVAEMAVRSKEKWQEPAFRERMLVALRNKVIKNPQEYSEKQRIAQTGRKHSAETRAKMSAWQIGKELSEETKAKMSAALTGRALTPEHRAKVGRPQSAESRQASSDRLRGREFSDETRARISAGLRAAWASGKKQAKPRSK